jgi:hypothetical protein
LERIAQRLLTAETLSGEELRRMLTESPPMAV